MSVRCGCWKKTAPHEPQCEVLREERRLFERLVTAASPRDFSLADGPDRHGVEAAPPEPVGGWEPRT